MVDFANKQAKTNYPTLVIGDDQAFLFYINLKQKETDSTMYPICIIVQEINTTSTSLATTINKSIQHNSISYSEDLSINTTSSNNISITTQYTIILGKRATMYRDGEEVESGNEEISSIENTSHKEIEGQ